MADDRKEWLVRQDKKNYIGPFSTASLRQLIREMKIDASDEIARSAGQWCKLKDSPTFSSLFGGGDTRSDEEKTIRLLPEEKTVSVEIQKRQTFKWRWAGGFLLLLVVFGFFLYLTSPPKQEKVSKVIHSEGEVTEPTLKVLSEALQQYNLVFYQGKLEESAGEYKKAIQSYQRALKFNPTDTRAKLRLIVLQLLAQENIAGFRKELLTLLGTRNLEKSQRVEIQNFLGICALKENDINTAILSFMKAIRLDTQFSPAHFNLGYSYFLKKEYYHAREEFERALQLEPNMPFLYVYLGRTFQKLGKFGLAVGEYLNAHKINPSLRLPIVYLSLIYATLKEVDLALSYLKKLSQLDPDYDGNVYTDPAFIKEEFDYSFLIDAYLALFKNKNADVLAGLAEFYYLDGKKKEAESMIQKALRLNDKEVAVHTIYGFILLKEGHFPEALRRFQSALRYQYENARVHLSTSDIHMKFGRYEEAVEHSRKVLTFDPNSVKAHTTLGVAFTHLDRVSEGVEAFRKALEYDPNYMPAKKMLLHH